jgi:hypothetical protein
MPENCISRVVDGVTLVGKWSVDPKHEIITVRNAFGFGTKSTQLGGSLPQCLAMIMLRELYEDMRPHCC